MRPVRPEELQQVPLFARVPYDTLESAAPLFNRRVLGLAEPLWFEDDDGSELGIISFGGLSVRFGVQEVNIVRAGELIGEISALVGEPRTATLVAAEPTEVLLLPREGLATLRSTFTDLYDRVLERALDTTARRIREVDLRIATRATGGEPQPQRKPSPSLLKSLVRFGAPVESDTVPVLPVLRSLPMLKLAPNPTLLRLAAALIPRRLEGGQALFLEGDPGDTAYLLMDGEIDVLRHVRGGRAQKLARLKRGAVFGTGSLLLSERRNASCVAVTPCKLREMSAATMAALPEDALRSWRESLLFSLRFQLRGASTMLAELKGGTSLQERQRLKAAAAQLVAFAGDQELEDPWTFRGRGAP